MADDFSSVFAALKPVLAHCAERLSVKTDTPAGYVLDTRTPSPFPQHKGHPLFFGALRLGKAYVSVHLMPLYMCPKLNQSISPMLKKRMQGKTCFNFKAVPEKSLLAELDQLAQACLEDWSGRRWL